MFGRESAAAQQRIDRVGHWARCRSPYALCSGFFGLLAVPDAITGVFGAIFGVIAITLGVFGLVDLKRRPHLHGSRLCYFGMGFGALGVLVGVTLWTIIYPMLAESRS